MIDGMTDCRLCGTRVRIAETDDGRRVVLNATGGVDRGEGRYLLDDERPTRAVNVAATHHGYAYKEHRATCPYGFRD